MGNSTSSALSKEILEDLKLSTKFTENEISQWYENFQKQCPTGRITPEEFEQIYTRFFPDSDAKSYARHVFRSFDTNDDGTLDFKEYIIALHMTSTGKTTRKLEWAFSLFDVDKNGYINKTEVTEICQVRRKCAVMSNAAVKIMGGEKLQCDEQQQQQKKQFILSTTLTLCPILNIQLPQSEIYS